MPGVPASTSRNGASAATDWLAFKSAWPTTVSNVCASSRRTTSGRWRQRKVSNSDKVPRLSPSSQPTRPIPIDSDSEPGRMDLKRPGGTSEVASASTLRKSLGVRHSTSMRPSSFSTSP